MLLLLNCWSLCNLKCCCGAGAVRFAIRNVAVLKLLVFWAFAMLLWWNSCSFLEFAMMLWCNSCSLNTLPCCCGDAPVRFAIRNVAVVKLLLAVLFAMLLWWTCCSFLILNVAVVKLLLVLKLAMLLWWTSNSFWDLQCCCDEAAARFLNCFVAVVKLLLVLRFAMLMWWSSSSLCHSECTVVKLLLIFIITN